MTMITVQLNGQSCQLADGSSLQDLLQAAGLAGRRLAVEVNLDIVPRAQHATHGLRDGDRIEVVQAIGGG
jgi:sulfur carrier protein